MMITCAAPIPIEVLKFFAKLKIDISEIWGMNHQSSIQHTQLIVH